MAVLYKANETDFNHLGLGPLNDAVSILVTEERNGMFELEMTYPIEGSRFVDLKLDRLIKADAGYNLKNQRFKIIRITKPIDGIVTVNAEHVSYLTQDLALKPTVNYSGNASQALNTWNNNIVDDSPFIVASDITTTGSGSWSIKDVKNAREALGGVSGSILETYGGEYRFDNYSIRLMAQRGVNSGALIAYGRNLVDLTQEETIADTFTSVYPYSVYQDANNKEVLLTLPEYFIDSEYVGNYARRKILPVDFSGDKIKDVAILRSRAASYVKSNGVGIPKVNMKIKYIDLAKTLDYKDLAILEEVNLCDNVSIYFEQLGVNASAKIIKTVWDDLLEQYDSIEVGEAKSSLSNSINGTVDGKLESIVQRVNTIQLTADGLNVIYRGIEQPPNGNIGDLWYEPDGIYENMYQWDGSIWKKMLSTRDLGVLKQEIESAIAQADLDRIKAEQDINQALIDAKNYTEVKAQEFDSQLLIVNQNVLTAANSANAAVLKADKAIEDVGFMRVDVDAAKVNAIDALTKAQSATDNVNSLSTSFDALTQTVGFKAEKAQVNAISGVVDQHTLDITANAQAINARLTSAQVDSLVSGKGYVNQAQLTATSSQWNLALTQVSTDLDISKIGSRNLLIRKNEKVGYLAGNGSIVSSSTGSRTMFTKIKVTPGEVLTFTKGASGTDPYWRWDLYNSSGVYVNRVTNDKNLFQWTVPAFVSEIQVSYPNVNEIMIERGSAATVYRPAPEDTPTLEQFTTIDATVKGLQTTVGDKADETKVTQLANQWTQTTALANGHTGQISNLGEQINFRVTLGQVTEAILADKKIKDTRNDNQLPEWYYTNYPRQTVEEFKTRVALGILGTATFGQLTTKVPWNNNAAFGVVITQTFRSSDGVFQRVSNVSGTFWESWDKVAEAGKLISQINLSTEGILLQGKRIQLDGDVTMTSAFVTDIKTKSLEAVYADIPTIRNKVLITDSVTAGMVKADAGLFDKVFINDAVVQKLTANSSFINSIKAIDITADRITGGLFNGANMNIININASAIVANALSAITTNTGALNVSDWLTFSSDNKGIRATYDFGDPLNNSFDPRWFLGSYTLGYRYMKFQSDVYTVNSTGGRGNFGYYAESYYGADYFKLRQFRTASNPELLSRTDMRAEYFSMSTSYTTSNIYLNANGDSFFSGNMQVGGDLSVMNLKALKAYYVQAPDSAFNLYINGGRNDLGSMRFGVDGSELNGGRLVSSDSVYKRTYGSAANMVVFDTGTIGRSVSARKYKLNIQAENLLETALKTLEINPSSWFDKGEVESIAKTITNGTEKELDPNFQLKRYHGFIADEFHELGATEVVSYNSKGEIEGLAYDRITMYHHELIRDLYNQIEKQNKKIEELERKIA